MALTPAWASALWVAYAGTQVDISNAFFLACWVLSRRISNWVWVGVCGARETEQSRSTGTRSRLFCCCVHVKLTVMSFLISPQAAKQRPSLLGLHRRTRVLHKFPESHNNSICLWIFTQCLTALWNRHALHCYGMQSTLLFWFWTPTLRAKLFWPRLGLDLSQDLAKGFGSAYFCSTGHNWNRYVLHIWLRTTLNFIIIAPGQA